MRDCKNLFSTVLFFLLLSFQLSSQPVSLLRSIPEAEGVSSKGIIEFLNAITQSRNELHSIMIVRHGKVITEGWMNPYRRDLKHTMYSCSKSFTSTAIGFAVSEKKISLNDKVISFFPNKLPDTVSNYLSELTIKDLISMSVGQAPDPTVPVGMSNDWIKTFLATPILNKPGSVFLYNSAATYMLSAIIQKVTGQKVIDYLTPRLFKPLGIQGMDWETDLNGINTGGWGLRLKTEDMARFALLYLQKGKWNGKQLLPAAWVEEATTFKIDNAPGASQSKKDSSDWMQGYCYQFWRSRHNSFRGDGAFGQYMLVLPQEDAVIAITSETMDMQNELNLVWQYILPAMHADPSALNRNDAIQLKKRLSSLQLPLPAKADSVFHSLHITGKNYKMDPNEKNIESVSFGGNENMYTLTLNVRDTVYKLNYGKNKWMLGVTNKRGPSLTELSKENLAGLAPYHIAGTYRWAGPATLEMRLKYIDGPHTEIMTFYFEANDLTMDLQTSFKRPDQKITLKGEIIR